PVLTAATDSGSSSADGITSADPLQFQDTCTTGDSMLLYDDTAVVAGPTLCAGGVVTFSVSAIAEGTHPINVTATRASGSESAHSNVQMIVVDRTAPVLSIDSAPQTNMVSTSATFTFHADDATPLQCQLDGGAFTACTSPQTYNSLSLGAHSFALAATDTAGNVANPQTGAWTIIQPLASGAPMLTPDSDSGRSSSDGVSNAAVATFMGACTDGDSMQLYDGNATEGTAATCTAGVYNIGLIALMEGTHSISVTSTRNGIESVKSPATAVVIDRTAPSVPSITAVENPMALTITVHGLAEPNALVTIHDGATSVCTAIADAAANFNCDGQLVSGDSSNLTAAAADVAGNVSGDSAPYGVIPDQVFRNGFDD
ncbi:MAG TPA: Ig-like domain-containing protein, partial [Vicinamibacterales bacterium]|nr:Ig-like domain-containing protein [Vicinamibacterales bacterium]